ncbi:MAG: mechanosensitive ion channel family protein [Bacilli bacterium]|nr:mechanosensitive ion channel family protein [Bacilli bacterium]MDD4607587.1 mechanosensitive ion channel family protein [Bacilli bacterium]
MLEKILIREVIAPICIIISAIILYMIISSIIKKLFMLKVRGIESKKRITLMILIKNIIKYFIITIAILMILEVFGVDTGSLVASLGVVGIVVGLALQGTLQDFVSGMTIILENQYNVGDNVTIGDFRGTVISLGLKTTKIKAFTGEVKIISNRNITEVINHSIENATAIVYVPVSYKTDTVKVEKVLNKLCEKLTNELEDITGDVQLLGVDQFNSTSINYMIIVETIPLKQFGVQREIKKQIKLEFDKNKIVIPYQNAVIYDEQRI